MKKKETATEQLNLRVSHAMISDVELLAELLQINKSEWIKTKLGELIYEEKSKIAGKYAELAEKGLMDKKEVEKLVKRLYHQ